MLDFRDFTKHPVRRHPSALAAGAGGAAVVRAYAVVLVHL